MRIIQLSLQFTTSVAALIHLYKAAEDTTYVIFEKFGSPSLNTKYIREPGLAYRSYISSGFKISAIGND